jgi:hypothetical protein
MLRRGINVQWEFCFLVSFKQEGAEIETLANFISEISQLLIPEIE